MLFPAHLWPGLRAGNVTVAFRRWKRPTVKASGTLQPRVAVRQRDDLDDEELAELRRALERLDWAAPVLRLTPTIRRW